MPSVIVYISAALTAVCLSCSPPMARTKVKHGTGPAVSDSAIEEEYDEPVAGGQSGEKRQAIVKTAMSFVGTPYKPGGSDPRGFDCSGLSMYVFKKNRISIDRTARAQYAHGIKVKKRNMRPGDLVFFTISGKSISHVGIYIGRGKFVHAPSSGKHVEVEELSSIYWKPRFKGAATYLR